MATAFSKPPADRLPDRMARDGQWTPVYESGPVQKVLGFVWGVVWRVLFFWL